MEHITTQEYATRVENRCSKEFHDNLIPGPVLATVLSAVGDHGLLADAVKKGLFYGKLEPEWIIKYGIIAATYGWEPKDGLLSTVNGKNDIPEKQQRLVHAILGIITEAGELADALIAAFARIQQGKATIEDAFDHVNIREELGDVLWYTQLGATAIGSSLPEVMTVNDNKLERRYGPAFSADKATNRDLHAERKELEQ